MTIRNVLANWLLKNKVVELNIALEKAEVIVQQYEVIRSSVSLDGKEIHLAGITALLGNLSHCDIKIEPHIHPRIVLSELKLESLLHSSGGNQIVQDNNFQGGGTAVEYLPKS